MYQYMYKIAGMRIRGWIPFPVVIQEEGKEFFFLDKAEGQRAAENGWDNARAFFRPVKELPDVPEKAVYWSDHFYSRDREGRYQVHCCPGPDRPPYACVLWEQDKEGRPVITCSYLTGNEFRFGYSRMISDHIGMETFFLYNNCLMLHASFVRWRGKGILFTAPSGTGKSTQADLWKKYENAEILNGDRAAVRKAEDGCWRAYGLPYAGSSGIYRNENAVLAAVIVLRQAKENRLRSMGHLEMLRALYPETTIHHWEKEFIENAVTLLTELADEIPFYLLECRPDRGAVEAVKNVLIGGENLC